MKTSTIIEYGAFDLSAKPDSTPSTTDKQEFSALNKLKLPQLAEVKYSTLEKNHFALDGNFVNMGSTPDVAWWSSSMSDENGDFTTAPVLEINFSESHTTIGLTLTFSEYAYCNSLKIQYYSSGGTLISEKTFTPDSYEYFCEDVAENYTKIVITFNSTNVPYRYLKLYRILYGRGVLFQGENLVHANLLEQVNILSDEVTINTLDFVVFSDDDRFNILNPEGIFSTLAQGQEVRAYQVKNGETTNMGTFYIDSWESQNDNKMSFKCIDLIGQLDKSMFEGDMYPQYNGSTYDTKTVEDLIDDIFTSAGLTSDFYNIQAELQDIEIVGYIAPCTCREALQQILFTIGAIANTSRNDIIEIYKVEESEEPNEIPRANVFKGTRRIKQGEEITGISVISHEYKWTGTTEVDTDYTLKKGQRKITFENPTIVVDFVVNSGTASITKYNTNYIIVNVESNNASVTISTHEYKDLAQEVFIENQNASSNAKPNVLKIDGVNIINEDNVDEIAERILDYYTKSYTTDFTYVLDDEQVADNIRLEETLGNVLNGFVTELDIDMTGGYVTKAQVVAKVEGS